METQLFLTHEEVAEFAPKAKEAFIHGIELFKHEAPWSFRQEFDKRTSDDVFYATKFVICAENRFLAFQPNRVTLLWNESASEWEDFEVVNESLVLISHETNAKDSWWG